MVTRFLLSVFGQVRGIYACMFLSVNRSLVSKKSITFSIWTKKPNIYIFAKSRVFACTKSVNVIRCFSSIFTMILTSYIIEQRHCKCTLTSGRMRFVKCYCIVKVHILEVQITNAVPNITVL